MPQDERLSRFLLLPELKLISQVKNPNDVTVFLCEKVSDFEVCPRCAVKSTSVYDHRVVKIHDNPIRATDIWLKVRKRRFYCHTCRKPFTEPVPGVMKGKRHTERFRRSVLWASENFTDLTRVRKHFRCSTWTVYRSLYDHLQLNMKRHLNYPWPKTVGIDEHFFSQKQGFATTLCDLRKHKVFDIVKGRSEEELADYLTKLPGKEKVKIVCMDLSSTYRSIVRKYFPHAMIVADRFHVVRLMQHQCMKSFKELSDDIKYNRGVLAALRTKPERLTEERKALRDSFFKENPVIESLYLFQQRIHELLLKKMMTKKQCRPLVREFLQVIDMMKQSPFKPLQKLARTFHRWKEEIARMWRFTKSNGITEGFHRKMKLIQRRAYGFRNFENYRTRVRVLCK